MRNHLLVSNAVDFDFQRRVSRGGGFYRGNKTVKIWELRSVGEFLRT